MKLFKKLILSLFLFSLFAIPQGNGFCNLAPTLPIPTNLPPMTVSAINKANSSCGALQNITVSSESDLEYIAALAKIANSDMKKAGSLGANWIFIENYKYLIDARKLLAKNASLSLENYKHYNTKIVNGKLKNYVNTKDMSKYVKTTKNHVKWALAAGVKSKDIKNYANLKAATAKLNLIKKSEARVKQMEKSIAKIPSLSKLKLSHADMVSNIISQYNKLSNFEKIIINPMSARTLKSAEVQINKLIKIEEEKEVQTTEDEEEATTETTL